MKKYTFILTLLLAPLLCAAQKIGARAEFVSEVNHNFHSVERDGGDISHTFTLRNTGDAPLVVLDSRVNCSCVKVTTPHAPIMPGKSAEVKVRYEIGKRDAGTFSRVIKIYTNANAEALLLSIYGDSVER